MKVLPDYLIQYMPELEEALEELRLSVIDHAYELLKCLDIDELSSDDIRHKLELYSIKLENMTSDWLPNGRFYRIYSSIKHHRTRYNAIQSIVKSGGQFEGLWSSDFSEKQQFNYKLIQLLRHYQSQSSADGYFYISGDATHNASGSIAGSTLTALSTDVLLAQALPAGYTYIYVPWPRPHYPSDSNYFYNVHMLQYDRLHYAEDCNKPYGDDATYSTKVPASSYYFNVATAKQPPYWFDYHYVGDDKYPNLINGNYKWPITETGYYYDSDGNVIAKLVISKNDSRMYKSIHNGDTIYWVLVTDNKEKELLNDLAVEYHVDDSCNIIADSNSNWITNCHLHTRYKTSAPNRSQIFTPIERAVVFSNVLSHSNATKLALINVLEIDSNRAEQLITQDTVSIPLRVEICTPEYLENLENTLDNYDVEYSIEKNSIDTNCLTEPDLTFSPMMGAYRYDRLTAGLISRIKNSLHHIKTYRPVWDTPSPIANMLQSSFASGIDGSSSRSLFYWMQLKQDNNIIGLDNNVIQYNEPQVSKITFTSYDRPTAGHLDNIYLAMFYAANETGHSQGDAKSLSDTVTQNKLYIFDGTTPIAYDPRLSYTVVSFNAGTNTFEDDFTHYMIGHPAAQFISSNDYKCLLVNKNSASAASYSHVLYKTSYTHKLWFASDKSDVTILSASSRENCLLYNSIGSTNHYLYSSLADNKASLVCNVIGVYKSDGTKLDTDSVTVSCAIVNNGYLLYYNTSEDLTASYVLFTVDVINEPMSTT